MPVTNTELIFFVDEQAHRVAHGGVGRCGDGRRAHHVAHAVAVDEAVDAGNRPAGIAHGRAPSRCQAAGAPVRAAPPSAATRPPPRPACGCLAGAAAAPGPWNTGQWRWHRRCAVCRTDNLDGQPFAQPLEVVARERRLRPTRQGRARRAFAVGATAAPPARTRAAARRYRRRWCVRSGPKIPMKASSSGAIALKRRRIGDVLVLDAVDGARRSAESARPDQPAARTSRPRRGCRPPSRIAPICTRRAVRASSPVVSVSTTTPSSATSGVDALLWPSLRARAGDIGLRSKCRLSVRLGGRMLARQAPARRPSPRRRSAWSARHGCCTSSPSDSSWSCRNSVARSFLWIGIRSK